MIPTSVDLLVFGPHPDDIEIGFGGAAALHAARGFRVGLCDLTRGELGSNGTVDERLDEAEAARAVLGADWRLNFGWPDGGPYDTPAHADDVVRLVRAARPEVVALPYWNDRHPDHRAASEMLARAVFKAGLRRYLPSVEAWRPRQVCYYFINDDAPVSFALDLRRIAARQPLPGYRLQIERDDHRELLRIWPDKQSTVPVENHVNGIGTSGARTIGTSGANRAAHSIEESNRESNSSSLTHAHAIHGAGATRRGAP